MAKLTSSGKLPDKASLRSYDEKKLVKLLSRFGQDVDVDALVSKFEQAFLEREGVRQLDDALIERMLARVDSSVKGWLLDEGRSAISEYRWQQMLEDEGKSAKAQWIAVTDSGTCDSCLARHKEVETLADWDILGRPGSSNLICRKRCRCSLITVNK